MSINEFFGFVSEWLGAIGITWLLSLSPRFQHAPVGFLYPRRDGVIALSLYGLILAFSILYYTRISPPVFTDPMQISPAPVNDLRQALILAAVCLAAFLIALVVRKQPARSTGWNPGQLRAGLQAGLALAILTIFLRNRVMDVLNGMGSPDLNALPLALGIALAEETIFRGYIHLRLSWWVGKWPGLVLTAALFAMWHLPAWRQGLTVETALLLLGLTFLQGLVQGWIMNQTGHVVAPAFYRAISIWISFMG